MKIHICEGDLHLQDTLTRLPFRYGIVTMTQAPHLFLRLRVEVDGTLVTGLAADGLPPKWFTKDPQRPIEDEILEMLRVIENALALSIGLRADHAFGAWEHVRQAQAAWGKAQGLPPLLTQFGTSLVERALLEAVCRAASRPFHELLHLNAFGPCLAGLDTDDLRATPLRRIVARHTVGLLDPLTEDDIPPAERLADGLPQSFDSCLKTYGLRQFKIKVFGDLERDRERLRRLEGILRENAPQGTLTLDGNEQFRSWTAFRDYWEELTRDKELASFFDRLLFVEQPLHRAVALDPAHGDDLRRWRARPPLLIDESDDEPEAMRRAWDMGYAGTSHKNCKGIFKSIVNVALSERRRRIEPGRPSAISGEDLANIGPVALLQDLAVCATLGIGSVERNGHHYFAGLSMWPDDVQRHTLDAHGDLYQRSPQGWPTLRIHDGLIAVDSLNRAPLGVGFEVPVDRFLSPDAWRRQRPFGDSVP